jgi:hypothetical protein
MNKLITVQKAKQEIKRLQEYVTLAESYEEDTLEKAIIKEYAITNNLSKVIEKVNERGFTQNDKPVDRAYVVSVVNGDPEDELHRIMRKGYRAKIRPNIRKFKV